MAITFDTVVIKQIEDLPEGCHLSMFIFILILGQLTVDSGSERQSDKSVLSRHIFVSFHVPLPPKINQQIHRKKYSVI